MIEEVMRTRFYRAGTPFYESEIAHGLGIPLREAKQLLREMRTQGLIARTDAKKPSYYRTGNPWLRKRWS